MIHLALSILAFLFLAGITFLIVAIIFVILMGITTFIFKCWRELAVCAIILSVLMLNWSCNTKGLRYNQDRSIHNVNH